MNSRIPLLITLLFFCSQDLIYSQWTTSGSGPDIEFGAGNVGIGSSSLGARLHVSSPDENDVGIEDDKYILRLHDRDGSPGKAKGIAFSQNGSTGYLIGGIEPNVASGGDAHLDFFNRQNGVITRILRLAENGRVGIGTTTPQASLHIISPDENNVGIEDNKAILWLTDKDGGSGKAKGIAFAQFGDPGYLLAGIEPNVVGGGDAHLDFFNRQNGTITRVMRLSEGGNVGIGTTNPNAKLDISGDGSGSLHIGNGSAGAFKLVGNTATGDFIMNNSNIAGGDIDIQRRGNSALFIEGSDGNVGIGTTTPHEKLTVDGNIVAEEVIVKMSEDWPDYVFEEDYDLAPLEEVESHINEHKHLPETPSADEVHREGLTMSEMFAIQMKKIEELTLYMIDLKKENDSLKQRITTLEESR